MDFGNEGQTAGMGGGGTRMTRGGGLADRGARSAHKFTGFGGKSHVRGTFIGPDWPAPAPEYPCLEVSYSIELRRLGPVVM
jgi:hypothetical protein